MNNMQEANHSQVEQGPFGAVQHNVLNITPTSSEIGYLWSSYSVESMSVCFLKNFVAKSKDPDLHSVLQLALDVSSQRIKDMEAIFNSINIPIPIAFSDKDVDIKTKNLFADSFKLMYTRLMHKFVLIYYSNALTECYRSDFNKFFSNCISTSQEIYQKSTEVLLAKGLIQKKPPIMIPERVEYIHDKSYLGITLGKERPLNALEVTSIYSLMETKQLIRTLNTGYAQITTSEKIREFLNKSIQLADRHLKILASLLSKENLPSPSITEALVTNSKELEISDKLILTHSSAVIAYIITAYGLSETASHRADLIIIFRKLGGDLLGLAKEGAELIIGAGWLEKPPATVDRQKLVH